MFPTDKIIRHVKMSSDWGVVTFASPLVLYLRRRRESSSNSVWFGRAATPIQQPHNPAHIPLDTNRNQKPQDDALTRPERPILCAASGPHLTCVQLVGLNTPNTFLQGAVYRPYAFDRTTCYWAELCTHNSLRFESTSCIRHCMLWTKIPVGEHGL